MPILQLLRKYASLSKQVVATANGDKNPTKLKVGDIVLGADKSGNVVNKVEKIKTSIGSCIEINNGDFYFYENQIISVNGHFSHAFQIKKGNRLKHISGEDIIVTSVKKINKKYPFVKLDISGDHTYYLDGILVHNSTMYWYGGSGNWSDYTNHWSYNSGNSPADPASNAPTTTDDVIFDTLSHTTDYTMTINATANCANFTMGAPLTGKVTWAGTQQLNIYGSMNLSGGTAGITRTYTSTTIFRATSGTKTITTNGIQMYFTQFNGVGGTFQLADNLILSGTLSPALALYAGTFDANGKDVSIPSAGACGITGNFTFYNLILTGNSINFNFSTQSITIQNTLTINGYSASQRLQISSSSTGTAVTITAANVSITNADFRDIIGAGAADWDLSAISSGDCGGNSGITFATPADQHWVNTNGGDWSDAANWTSRVPLPQDNVFMDCAFGTSKTVSADRPRFGKSIDWTGATWTTSLNWSISGSSNYIFGSLTLINGLTLPGVNAISFAGRGDYVLTQNSVTLDRQITLNAPTGSLKLGSNLTLGVTRQLRVTNGTFTAVNGASNYVISTGQVYVDSGGTLSLGSATHLITGTTGGVWSCYGTLNEGTSTIKLTGVLTNVVNFNGINNTFYNFWNATTGAFAVYVYDDNTFNNFKVNAGRTTKFETGSTQHADTYTLVGTAGNLITLAQISGLNQFYLEKLNGGNVVCDYLHLTYSNVATESGAWYAGSHSTDNGNNTGWQWGDFFDKELTDSVVAIPTATNLREKYLLETVAIIGSLLKQGGKIFTQIIQAVSEITTPLVKIFSENLNLTGTYEKVLTAVKTITDRIVPKTVLTKVLTAKKTLTEALAVIGARTAQTGRILTERFVAITAFIKTPTKLITEALGILVADLTTVLSAGRTLLESIIVSPVFTKFFAFAKTLIEVVNVIASNTYSMLNTFVESIVVVSGSTYKTFSTLIERIIVVVGSLTFAHIGKIITNSIVVSGTKIYSVSRTLIESFIVAPLFEGLKVALKVLTQSLTVISSKTSQIGRVFTQSLKVIPSVVKYLGGRIFVERLKLFDNNRKSIRFFLSEANNDYIEIPDKNYDPEKNLNLTKAMTLEIWVTPDEVIKNPSECCLLAKSDSIMYGLLWESGGNVLIFILNSNAEIVTDIGMLNYGSPNHIVVTWDNDIPETPNMFIYVNDVLVGTGFKTEPLEETLEKYLRIGKDEGGSRPSYEISVDEARIYGRAITPEEVSEHYQGIFKDESNLRGLWHFSEYSDIDGNQVWDSSGNENHGLIYGDTERVNDRGVFPSMIISWERTLTETINIIPSVVSAGVRIFTQSLKVGASFLNQAGKMLIDRIVAVPIFQSILTASRTLAESVKVGWSKLASVSRNLSERIIGSDINIQVNWSKLLIQILNVSDNIITTTSKFFVERVIVGWFKLTYRSFVYLENMIVGGVMASMSIGKLLIQRIVGTTSWLFEKTQYVELTEVIKAGVSLVKSIIKIFTQRVKMASDVIIKYIGRLFEEGIIINPSHFQEELTLLFGRVFSQTLAVVSSMGEWVIGKLIVQPLIVIGNVFKAGAFLLSEIIKVSGIVLGSAGKLLIEAFEVISGKTIAVGRIITQIVKTSSVVSFRHTFYKTLSDAFKVAGNAVLATGRVFNEALEVVSSMGSWVVGKLLVQPIKVIDSILNVWTLGRLFSEVIKMTGNFFGQSVRVFSEVLTASSEFILGTISKMLVEIVKIYEIVSKTLPARVFSEIIIATGNAFNQGGKIFVEVLSATSEFILGTISKLFTETITIIEAIIKVLTANKVLNEVVKMTGNGLAETGRIFSEVVSVAGTFILGTISKMLLETIKVGHSIVFAISRVFAEVIKIGDNLIRTIGRIFTEAFNVANPVITKLTGRTFTAAVVVGTALTRVITRTFTQTIRLIGNIWQLGKSFILYESVATISAMGNFVIGKLLNENVIAHWHRAKFVLNGIMVGLWKKVARVTNGLWHKIKRDDN